jgi:chromosome partitioning protein
MKIIALLGQKGGTGKTTTATGLAVAASLSGYQTAILDLDPQANAANWKDRRGVDSAPAVISVVPGRLPQAIEAARDAGAEFVFIDTPGKSSDAAIAAAKAADLVLIPVRRQVFDLETLAAVKEILQFAGNPLAAIVVNGIHPSTRDPASEAQRIGEGFGIPAAPVYLSQRAAFADAPAAGQGPQEYDPTGKAAAEINALFAYVQNATGAQVHQNTKGRKKAHG